MSKAKGRGEKSPPFVQVLKATLAEPAWRDLTYGARCLYVCIKSYWNGQNNGRVYLSVRKAAAELNASRASVEEWFTELQNHGFIVMTKAGFLGTEGKGSARYWRLTELGTAENHMPSRDFKKWPDLPQQPLKRYRPKTKPCHENWDAVS